MSVIVKNIIPRKQAEATQTTQYTAVNCRTVIDKFTSTNTGLANAVLSVNLCADGSSPGVTNAVLYQRAIAPGESYTCPELVGQCLEPGGFISTLANTVSLTISATGRELT